MTKHWKIGGSINKLKNQTYINTYASTLSKFAVRICTSERIACLARDIPTTFATKMVGVRERGRGKEMGNVFVIKDTQGTIVINVTKLSTFLIRTTRRSYVPNVIYPVTDLVLKLDPQV